MGINPQGVSVKAVQKILKVISGLFPDEAEIKPNRYCKRYPRRGNSQYCGSIHQTEKKKYRCHDPGKDDINSISPHFEITGYPEL